MKNRHFYFKLGKGNKYLNRTIKIEDTIELFVFFNQTTDGWKASSFLNPEGFDEAGFREKAEENKLKKRDVYQSIEFIQMSYPERRKASFLWVFAHPYVFVFQPDGDVYDGTPAQEIEENQQPKTFKAKCVRRFEIDEVPEFFATLHANQAYNRPTLVELKNTESKIAEHLLTRKSGVEKLKIKDNSERFDFLSPVQFETLIFLLFHHAGAFCSTYRGGTLKDIDLKIQFSGKPGFPEFKPDLTYFLQIKKKSDNEPWKAQSEKDFQIWLGASGEQRLGKNWLENATKKYPKVEQWLDWSLGFLEI